MSTVLSNIWFFAATYIGIISGFDNQKSFLHWGILFVGMMLMAKFFKASIRRQKFVPIEERPDYEE